MYVREFKYKVTRGLGSAILHLKNHPNEAKRYANAIYRACIRNTALDAQSEGSRAHYLWELIQLSGISEQLQDRILDEIGKRGDYDREQIYRLAKYFAQSGNQKAIQLMKEHLIWDSCWNLFIGAEEIIELEGINGFQFVAEKIGKKCIEEPGYWDEAVWDFTVEKFGEELVITRIEQACTSNPKIQAYYQSIQEAKKRTYQSTPKRKVESYQQVKERIESFWRGSIEGWRLVTLIHWGSKATKEELQEAAIDFLQETDLVKCKAYLHIFFKSVFPLDPTKLDALEALAHVRDQRVRELAIERIPTIKDVAEKCYLLDLLTYNYEELDYRLIETILMDDRNDDNDLESLGHSLTSIYTANKTSNCQNGLIYLYQNGACAICREKYLEIMIDQNVLPEWILQEARYDSNLEIREMISKFNIK